MNDEYSLTICLNFVACYVNVLSYKMVIQLSYYTFQGLKLWCRVTSRSLAVNISLFLIIKYALCATHVFLNKFVFVCFIMCMFVRLMAVF